MEPLLYHRNGNGYNPDFGAHLKPKSYMETFNPQLYALMLRVKEVFDGYEYGKAQETVNALAKIVESAQSEDWAEKPLTLDEVFAKAVKGGM